MKPIHQKKKVGIIGGAGYTAGELIRLLVNHPMVELSFVHSSSNAGIPVSDVHTGMIGETSIVFSDSHPLEDTDILFLCSAHGHSRKFWQDNKVPDKVKVIDLAQDFRDESDGYVYGLPELNRDRISRSSRVANPGCFATAIQLSLLPLANAGLLHGDININALTGSTGAGVKPGATTHFSWRTDNISVYKPFTHQHLLEIGRTLRTIQPDHDAEITFIPMRGDFARGIFVALTLRCSLTQLELEKLYIDFYSDHPFVIISPSPVCLKQSVNTNKAVLHLDVHDGKMLVTCAIDNLLKGASGQAVQNMNIMCGWPEKTGLNLKASAF